MTDFVKDALKVFEKDKRTAGMHIGRASELPKIDVIPSGIDELDSIVFGIGGIPRGYVTQFWGPFESGKSTLAMHIVANMQQHKELCMFGGTAAVFETEGKFDKKWWEAWGVDTDRVIMGRFNFGEEAWYQIRKLVGKVDLILLDSVAALVSREEAVRGDTKQRLAPESRMNATELPKLINGTLEVDANGKIKEGMGSLALKYSKTAFIFINQIRSNIGVVYGLAFKRKGGHVFDHLCTLIVRVEKLQVDKERDDYGGVIRQKVKIRCDRNNFGPPQRQCETWLNLKEHKFELVSASFMLNRGIDKGIFEQRGSWIYSNRLPEGKLQGIDKLMVFLETEEGKILKNDILGIDEILVDAEDEVIEDPKIIMNEGR